MAIRFAEIHAAAAGAVVDLSGFTRKMDRPNIAGHQYECARRRQVLAVPPRISPMRRRLDDWVLGMRYQGAETKVKKPNALFGGAAAAGCFERRLKDRAGRAVPEKLLLQISLDFACAVT
jgi:hypothetical protein